MEGGDIVSEELNLVQSYKDTCSELATLCKAFSNSAVSSGKVVAVLIEGYLKCRNFGNETEEMWKLFCEKYPYDNVALNTAITEALRDTWRGRAILFSLFCGTFVTLQNNSYYTCKGSPYYIDNDSWIGVLRSAEWEELPFVEESGVTKCRDAYLNSPETAKKLTAAAETLYAIYTYCGSCRNPRMVWHVFTILYGAVARHFEGPLRPYLSNVETEKHDFDFVRSIREHYYVNSNYDPEYGEEYSSVGIKESLGGCLDLYGKFFDNFRDFIIH